jgi:hypothetical protein
MFAKAFSLPFTALRTLSLGRLLNSQRTLASARQASIALTFVAVILWSYSITQAEFTIGFYGLIHSLPPSFFVSLGFLTVASATLWVSPRNEGRLLLLQLILFIAALWLTPLLIGGALPFKDIAYEHWAFFVNPITQEGDLQGHLYPEMVWYHNWPGYWLLLASEVEILGIDIFPDAIVSMYPFLFQLLLLLPLYLLLKNVIDEERANYRWAAAWLFCLGSWTGQFYLATAQGAGYFLSLMLLAVLTRPLGSKQLAGLSYGLIAIVLVAALTISHFVSTLYILFIIAALFVAKRVPSYTLPVLATVFAASWMMYYATFYFDENIARFIEGLFRGDALLFHYLGVTGTGFGEAPVASASHTAVARVRLFLTLLLLLIAFLGFIVAYRRRMIQYGHGTVLAITAGCMASIGVVSAAYGFEAFERWWLFLLVPMAYFGTGLLRSRPSAAILVALLLIASPLHIIAHTGNQAIDHLSPQWTASSRFLGETVPSETYASGSIHPWFATSRPILWRGVAFEDLEWREGRVTLYAELTYLPHYISIGERERRHYTFALDEPEYIQERKDLLERASNYNLIYDNASQRVYQSPEQE